VAIDPRLGGTCLVRGTVVDPDEGPLEGATIYTLVGDLSTSGITLERYDPFWRKETITSALDGGFSYVVQGLCPHGIAATTPDGKRRGECRTGRRPESPVECVLVVEESWPLRGVVADASGQPVEGARVSASPSWNVEQSHTIFDPDLWGQFNHHQADLEALWSVHDSTGDQGEFELARVLEDDWILMVEKLGFKRAFASISADGLLDGQVIHITLQPWECWTVRVLDGAGAPVPEAKVEVGFMDGRLDLGFHEGRTDVTGADEICAIASTNAIITVEPLWHTRDHGVNLDGTDPRIFVVHPTGSLTGTIHCPNESSLLTGFCKAYGRNCVAPDGSECSYSGSIMCPNVERSFVTPHVTIGEMDLEIRCGGDQSIERHVIVNASEALDLGSMVFTDTWRSSPK